MTPRLFIALSLVFTAACAEDLTALGPFPCAADSTCPDSFVCASGVTYGSDGMCVLGCSSSDECQEGYSCGAMEEVGGGACLQECEPFGSDCEPGTTCRLQPRSDEGSYFATCVAITAASEQFVSCEHNRDCPPQDSCYKEDGEQEGTCRPNCDKHHECRRNLTCEPLLPSGAGVCVE